MNLTAKTTRAKAHLNSPLPTVTLLDGSQHLSLLTCHLLKPLPSTCLLQQCSFLTSRAARTLPTSHVQKEIPQLYPDTVCLNMAYTAKCDLDYCLIGMTMTRLLNVTYISCSPTTFLSPHCQPLAPSPTPPLSSHQVLPNLPPEHLQYSCSPLNSRFRFSSLPQAVATI